MYKHVFCGRQEEVAAHIAGLLYGETSNTTVKLLTDYLRIQRGARERAGRSNVFTWRGIGIDVTPRACACWIEDPAVLRSWQECCRV